MEETIPEEWIAVAGWGRFEALPVVKRSPKQIVARDGVRNRHILIAEVKASGEEAAIRKLVERLNSSKALADYDRSKAGDRHVGRVEKLLADFAATSIRSGV